MKDITDGSYDQYAELGISDFPLYNPAMRKALGLPNDDKGILITRVTPTSSADGILKSGDVLISLDGQTIDSAGQVMIDGEKVDLAEIVERKFSGDQVAARVIREGVSLDFDIKIKPLPAARMYSIRYEAKPRYVVFAGLVFQPLDTNLFAASKFTDVTVRRLYTDYVSKGIFTEKKDIIILTQIQPDSVTSQMDDFTGLAVEKINGISVTSLSQAQELLNKENPPEFHTIELYGANRPLVIPSAEVEAANRRVQASYGISKLHNLEE
jgi:PDZ domain-containing secreted protein